MQTTSNNIMIPDNPGNSSDNFTNIVNAIINHGNALNTINGNVNSTQTDYNQGYIKFSNGFILQWGHATPKTMNANKDQVRGAITFPISFPHICLTVVGSDAGAYGMAFGFYGLNKSGCSWCTVQGLGTGNVIYAPNYLAIGW